MYVGLMYFIHYKIMYICIAYICTSYVCRSMHMSSTAYMCNITNAQDVLLYMYLVKIK